MTSSKEKDKKDDDCVGGLRDFMNHETRISLVERAIIGIEEKFKTIDSKLDTQLRWTIGTIASVFLSIAIFFGGIILRMAHII